MGCFRGWLCCRKGCCRALPEKGNEGARRRFGREERGWQRNGGK